MTMMTTTSSNKRGNHHDEEHNNNNILTTSSNDDTSSSSPMTKRQRTTETNRLLDVLMAARALSSISACSSSSAASSSSVDNHEKEEGIIVNDSTTTPTSMNKDTAVVVDDETMSKNDDKVSESASVVVVTAEHDEQEAAAEATTTIVSAADNGNKEEHHQTNNFPKSKNKEDEDDNESAPPTMKTFPEKLMDMLDFDDTSDVITWLPGGKSFSILKPEKFTTDVLPRFFKQSKFESFVRKLYRWGFRQVDSSVPKGGGSEMVTAGSHVTTFYHKHFQKGNVALAVQKLRSITPSRAGSSNNATSSKKEKTLKKKKNKPGSSTSRPSSSGSTSSHSSSDGSINFTSHLVANEKERPSLPASTQTLLAKLRKERGLGLVKGNTSTSVTLPHKSTCTKAVKRSSSSQTNTALGALLAARQEQQKKQPQPYLPFENDIVGPVLPASIIANGGSMATRMILKRLQEANQAASVPAATTLLNRTVSMSPPSPSSAGMSNSSLTALLLESQRRRLAAKLLQDHEPREDLFLLGQRLNQHASSMVGGGGGLRSNHRLIDGHGHEGCFVKPMISPYYGNSGSNRNLALFKNSADRGRLFQHLSEAQPSAYEKDIVQAAVDALNNAT